MLAIRQNVKSKNKSKNTNTPMNRGVREKTFGISKKSNGEVKDGFDSRTRYHLRRSGWALSCVRNRRLGLCYYLKGRPFEARLALSKGQKLNKDSSEQTLSRLGDCRLSRGVDGDDCLMIDVWVIHV